MKVKWYILVVGALTSPIQSLTQSFELAFQALPRPTAAYHDKPYPSISPTRPELSLKGKTILITGGGESQSVGVT